METGKTIHIIHAADAVQHLGKFKRILESLRNENRFDGYTVMESDLVNPDYLKEIGSNDGMIILLTEGIANRKAEIEEIVLRAKTKEPKTKAIEIIVDNLTFEHQFIALPKSLEPVRNKEDMDAVWQEIGDDLRSLFPVTKVTPQWLKYAVGIIILGLIGYFVGPILFGGKPPEANFVYTVLDPIKADLIDSAESCYLPCKVKLINKSINADNIEWELGDTTMIDIEDPSYVFTKSGEYVMKLTAKKGAKNDPKEKTLIVKAPPTASFEIQNNGCTAPCDVEFVNTSKNGVSYKWDFIGGTTPTTSDTKDPGPKRYTTHGPYQISLSIEDDEGIKSDTIQEITILRDNTPFAAFTYKNLTTKIPHPANQTYKFTSTSKNAGPHRWEIYRGATLLEVKTSKNFNFNFMGYNSYSVKLFVTGAGGLSDNTFRNIKTKSMPNQFGIQAYDANALRNILRTNFPN